MSSTRPFVRPFVCYQTCERDILKMKEQTLMQIVQVVHVTKV